MRSLAFALVLSAALFGCGKSEGDSDTPGAAGTTATGGSGTSAGEAGTNAAAGTASGGSGGAGGSGDGLVDCDPKKISCKRATPACDVGEVPSVDGTCYGECVKVERCGCSAAEQCPQTEQYTCWGKQHCGPYVQ